MSEIENSESVVSMLKALQSDPAIFLKTHQVETTILEYKSSFEFDTAMLLCPLVREKNRNHLLNQNLSYIIFKTLVAFANSFGGLLVMGVAEAKGAIVGSNEIAQCPVKNNPKENQKQSCFESIQGMPCFNIGNLQVFGLDRELAILEMDFDQFRRRFVDRFSLGTGKSRKKELKFKETRHPCMALPSRKDQTRSIRITMSESMDEYIHEVLPVIVADSQNNTSILGAVSVRPALKPIYLKIQESDSNTLLYALPVRKTGKTELENDPQRIYNYISNRFETKLAERIVKEIGRLSIEKVLDNDGLVDDTKLSEIVGEYALHWMDGGCAYHLVESLGKHVRAYTSDMAQWEGEERPEVKAFLLMVSLHYNTGWEKWTLKNKKNDVAVSSLLEALHMNYWRTRFRAFYVLQFMEQKKIKAELRRKHHQSLSNRTREILKTNVSKKTVVSFIKDIAESEMGDVSKKAKAVLIEIATLWNDPSAGIESPL